MFSSLIEAGDSLYLPCGVVFDRTSQKSSEDSISLRILVPPGLSAPKVAEMLIEYSTAGSKDVEEDKLDDAFSKGLKLLVQARQKEAGNVMFHSTVLFLVSLFH